MFLLVFLVLGLYLYKTGELQNIIDKFQRGGTRTNSAREIIDLRFAKGEISVDEYKRMKSTLD